jgi:hypothetical protein
MELKWDRDAKKRGKKRGWPRIGGEKEVFA